MLWPNVTHPKAEKKNQGEEATGHRCITGQMKSKHAGVCVCAHTRW